MARFHGSEGHTGGIYESKFTHDEGGHIGEQVIFKVMAGEGVNLVMATTREDEREGIDFKLSHPTYGMVKIQFKEKDQTDLELHHAICKGVVPIVLDEDLVMCSVPGSVRYRVEAKYYVVSSFKAQLEAYMPLAADANKGKSVNFENFHEAKDKADSFTTHTEYSGPQSFSPN